MILVGLTRGEACIIEGQKKIKRKQKIFVFQNLTKFKCFFFFTFPYRFLFCLFNSFSKILVQFFYVFVCMFCILLFFFFFVFLFFFFFFFFFFHFWAAVVSLFFGFVNGMSTNHSFLGSSILFALLLDLMMVLCGW